MSAALDRLRQIAAAWHRAVHVDSSTVHVHICDLDAVLADVSAERTRAVAAEADRDHWRAQATMAAPCVDAVRAITLRLIPGGTGCAVDPERVVAAVDGLRAECDRIDRLASRQAGEYMEAAHGLAIDRDAARRAATFAEMERDTLRGLTDAMREDNVRLRGIVAGRETAPTDADVAAHALAHPLPAPGAASNGATCDEPIGLWLCVVDGDGAVVLRLAREADDQGPYLMAWSSDYGWCGTGDIRRACPLDASGRPCPWPTPALGATGEER